MSSDNLIQYVLTKLAKYISFIDRISFVEKRKRTFGANMSQ